MIEVNGMWSTIGHRIVDFVKSKLLNAGHGTVNLIKQKLGVTGYRFLDPAGASAKRKFTRLLGKNAGQAAVNLSKLKNGRYWK